MNFSRWFPTADTHRSHGHRKTLGLAWLITFLVTLLSSSPGEKVDMYPQDLRDTATHVIVGTVLHVFQRQVRDKTWDTTYYIAETRVTEVEKGTGLEKGILVYARYWRRNLVLDGKPFGTNPNAFETMGHRGLPKDGETLRIYLAQNAHDGFGSNDDGGFNVIGANGFERLK
jgi:hypothetical protein